jgi:hypothetical protein
VGFSCEEENRFEQKRQEFLRKPARVYQMSLTPSCL